MNNVKQMPSRRELEEIRLAEEQARKNKIKKVVTGVCILAVMLLIAAAVLFILSRKQYTGYEVSEIVSESGAGSGCILYADGYVRYSGNGIAYITSSGKTVWDEGVFLQNPEPVICGKYGLIYDRSGTQAIVFSEDRIEAMYTAPLPIAQAGISRYGVTAVMMGREDSSLVAFYDRTGTKLDIEINNARSVSSGYPMDIALSDSGTGLIMTLLFMNQGLMQSRVSFMNFDVGKDKANRVVGLYEYPGSVFPEAAYLTEEAAVAFGDDKIVFYNLENPASPKVSKEIPVTGEIHSVCFGQEHAAVIAGSETGGKKLTVYDSTGEIKYEKSFDFEYTKFKISGDNVLIYGGETSSIISLSGATKYEGSFSGMVDDMISLGARTFLQTGDFGIRVVRLK